jgi:5-methylcytosine-specific restriction endonuclease McrA
MVRKPSVPERLRRQVQERAQGRCEYCLIHEADMYYPHEADHVIAEKHGGATSLENLAWACFYCNRFKGSDLASVDPASQKVVLLFNPREQSWNRHFRLTRVFAVARKNEM